MKKTILTIILSSIASVILFCHPVGASTLNQKDENDNIIGSFTSTQNESASNAEYIINNGVLKKGVNIENVVIPDGVTKIGKDAFRDYTNIKSVIIPEGVTDIEDRAFYGCTGLLEIKLPESLNNIYGEAFYGCTSLKSIQLPEGLTGLPGRVFMGCTALERVDIPNSFARFSTGVFYDCPNLNSIILSKNVDSIVEDTFNYVTYKSDGKTNNKRSSSKFTIYGNLYNRFDDFDGYSESYYYAKEQGYEFISVLEDITFYLNGGSSKKVKVNIEYTDAKWDISNKNIAIISEDGKVTPIKAGTTMIKAIIDGKDYTAKLQVINPSLNKTSATLFTGKTLNLELAGYDTVVQWSSNKSSIAKVDKSGKVTAVKPGEAIITAKVNDKIYKCAVTVKNSVYLNKANATVCINSSLALKMIGTDEKATWKSGNTKLAKVSDKGKVTGIKSGKVTITATVNGKSYSCKVLVVTENELFMNFIDEIKSKKDTNETCKLLGIKYSKITQYAITDFNKDSIPELILNNYVCIIKNGEVSLALHSYGTLYINIKYNCLVDDTYGIDKDNPEFETHQKVVYEIKDGMFIKNEDASIESLGKFFMGSWDYFQSTDLKIIKYKKIS